MKLHIICYNNNKKVYDIDITMNQERLTNQIKNGVLTYTNMSGDVEIINLRSFDKVVIEDFWNFEKFDRGVE